MQRLFGQVLESEQIEKVIHVVAMRKYVGETNKEKEP
jgi:hypothetical protein